MTKQEATANMYALVMMFICGVVTLMFLSERDKVAVLEASVADQSYTIETIMEDYESGCR